jgi:hypothetical protein
MSGVNGNKAFIGFYDDCHGTRNLFKAASKVRQGGRIGQTGRVLDWVQGEQQRNRLW